MYYVFYVNRVQWSYVRVIHCDGKYSNYEEEIMLSIVLYAFIRNSDWRGAVQNIRAYSISRFQIFYRTFNSAYPGNIQAYNCSFCQNLLINKNELDCDWNPT